MALLGIQPAQVGGEYDLAVGFDPGTGDTTMFGYVIETGTEWAEAPNIQDEQRIVQIASPNNSDRLTYYPKVTQDDWSGGEGQEFFTDPTKFYQSYKVDPTKPGHLVLQPGTATVSVTPRDPESRIPAVTDGYIVLAGFFDSPTSVNSFADNAGNLYYLNAAGVTPGVSFALTQPQGGGAWMATGPTSQCGIYSVPFPVAGAQPTIALWTSDVVMPTATQALAYMSAP